MRKRGQRTPKRQPCTARIAACPVRVADPVEVRGRRISPRRAREAWQVVVRVDNVDWEPWLLLTDWSVPRGRSGSSRGSPPKPSPGKTLLMRGLQRLLDHWATEAILRDEIRRHGRLPPRLAALLGPAWSQP